MEEFEVEMGEARIIQGASGNWYIHNAEGERISDAFRHRGDAGEWANAEGYTITEYISWGTEDNRH